jgi:hypothetical protein
MAIPPKKSDDGELSYEDFDDAAWVGDELEAIDLDALDADIPTEDDSGASPPPALDQAEATLLDAIDTLGDDLPPAEEVAEPAPVPAESLVVEEPAPSDAEPPAVSPAPVDETPPQPVADVEPAAELVAETAAEPAPAAESESEPAVEPASETVPEPEPAAGSDAGPAAELVAETVPEPAPAAESAVAPSPEVEAPAEAQVPPEPVIPPEVYCALLPLPKELAAQVVALRKTGEITTMPPPGIVLTAPFRTMDRPAVEAALAKWARAHLPFQFETVGVLAKIVDAQRYVAAWALEPEEEIVEAQYALRRALADLMLPLPGATMSFSAYVPIGEQIAAPRYPLVVAQMQHEFEPFVWHANDLQLVCQGEQPGHWDTITSFD